MTDGESSVIVGNIANEPVKVNDLKEKEIFSDNELCQEIDKKKEKYSQVLSPYKQRLNDYLDLYHSKPGQKYHRKAKSNIFIPETFRAIETLAAHLYQIIFSEEPFFIVEGRESNDETQSKILTGLLDYYFKDSQFKRRFLPALRTLLIYGVLVIQYSWKYQAKPRLKKILTGIDPTTQKPIYSVQEITEVIADRPDFDIINIIDLTLDPYATNIDEAEWVIVRKKFTYSQLLDWEKDGYISNVSELKKVGEATNKGKKTKEDELKEQRMKNAGFDVSQVGDGEYEVLDYWGKIKKSRLDVSLEGTEEGNLEVEAHVIKCQDVVLKKSENPYWCKEKPFKSCALFELQDEFFAMGLGQILQPQQEELNCTHNQMIDHKTFSIYHMMMKGKESGLKRKDLEVEFGKVMDCDDVNQLKEIRPDPAAMNSALALSSLTREDMRNDAGSPTILQGIESKGGITATEASAMRTEGSTRVRLLAISISEQIIKPLIEKYYELIQQYMTTEKVVKIIGKTGVEYQKVTADEVIGNWDFIPKVMTDVTNKVTIRENMITMLGIITKSPNTVPPQSTYLLIKKIYEYLDFKDGDTLFPPIPEQPQSGGMVNEGQGQIGTETPNVTALPAEAVIANSGMAGLSATNPTVTG